MARFKNHVLRAVWGAIALTATLSMTSHEAVAEHPHTGTAPITIINPLPVPVRNVDEPGLAPYQEGRIGTFLVTPCAFASCSVSFSAVPAGKRLVVTHISGRLQLQHSPIFPILVRLVPESGGSVQVIVPVTKQGPTTGDVDYYAFSERVQTYFDTSPPQVDVFLDTVPFAGGIAVTLTGYYVTIP
jgi:hypothetical protein